MPKLRLSCLPLLVGLLVLLGLPAAAREPAALTLIYYREGQAVAVERPVALSGLVQADAETALHELLAGPTAAERSAGLESALPAGAELAAVAVDRTVDGEMATVDLHLPLSFLRGELEAVRSDAIVEQIAKTLHPLGLHHLQVRARDEGGVWLPLSSFFPRPQVPVPTVPENDEPLPAHTAPAVETVGQPPVPGQGRPQGALTGKSVWLSAGHGWYWSDTLKRWTTQRGNNYGLVEDLSNAEAVNYYLARYLWNAGADVWLVRERAMNRVEVIVDNDAGSPGYSETGTWLTSSTPGYNGGTYRWTSTYSSQTSTATWRPDLPQAGWYAVWAWFRHGANRAFDARYQVHHAGGVTTVSISQEIHGMTWRYLGEYYFDAGTAGAVTLVNASDETAQVVIADAVRFGGGLGSIVDGGVTSGRPRWEEQSTYWATYQGAPDEVVPNDVVARPLYAEWETAKGLPGEGQNSAFISWHTNAGGGTGTESYIHVSEPTPGSAELQDWVHAELIQDLRAGWDPAWVDRGQKSFDFGELRELSTIPGVLLEVAFHDSEDPGDADDLREPVFRQIAARAVAQGIVRYFAARGGQSLQLAPEPPQRLVARNTAPGQVSLSWTAPTCCNGLVGDAATSYKVYHSVNGRAFDNGRVTTATGLVFENLSPGSLHFFRVTALNAGGESFPTPVVAARTPADLGEAPFLIVDGFDRLDQTAMVPVYEAYFLGVVQRMFLEQMNSYDYAVQHGQALAACGLAFDGAADEAVTAGDVVLGAYDALDWFTGEDSAADASLDGPQRALLAAYLDGGGRLLLSGAEIGYDLVELGRDPAFFSSYLRAGYAGDDAGTYAFAGVVDTPFQDLAGRFDAGYDVGYPDLLAPALGSEEVLSYVGGAAGAAAIAYDGDYRLVYAGFPLETVADPATRNALFCQAAHYLLGAPLPGAGVERLINPGFEGGLAQSAWVVQAAPEEPLLVPREDLPAGLEPHSGDWVAWLGGYEAGIASSVALTQVVALPAGEPAVALRLAWRVEPGTAPAPGDSLAVGVYDAAGTLQATPLTLEGGSLPGVWQTGQFDLGLFAGQTVQLVLRASSQGTAFFVDDVSLQTQGPAGAAEFRALWVDAYHPGFKTPQQIDELVETARAANLNALVVQVRRRGDTYYPSSIDPWAPDALVGFDALAYLVERAHAADLAVHAWLPAMAIWGDADVPPAAPEHIFNLHGPGATGQDYWLMESDTGAIDAGGVICLDAGHPAVADYLVDLVAELLAAYDLDGIHLDRIRYPGQNWGYNPTALARFQALTGRSDVPLPADAAWLQWRRDQVTAIVRRIYLAATATNPHVQVSAALSSAGSAPTSIATWLSSTPYGAHLQDWRAWLEEGILDLGLPMTYRDAQVDWEAADFAAWIAWEKDHQYGRGTAVGTGLYKNGLDDSMAQWQLVRLPSGLGYQAMGACGYSYATPCDRDPPATGRELANAFVGQVLTEWAPPPFLAWKEAPTRGHLLGQLVGLLPCTPADGLQLLLQGPEGTEDRSLAADGKGWFGAVDLLPGAYVLSVEIPSPATTIRVPVQVSAGVVAQAWVPLPSCAPGIVYLPLISSR